jgi:hypothetical protein
MAGNTKENTKPQKQQFWIKTLLEMQNLAITVMPYFLVHLA